MTNESRPKIAFQGEYGANSDTACREAHPEMEPLPCPTFEDAFAAVESGEAELAMIPIDNSLAGRVADIHHLLPQSSLHIVGEFFLPINFQLMALPGVSLDEITHVYSHIHALGQCRNVIRDNGWIGMVAGDTAGAAKRVAESGERSAAALAPRLAADLYSLSILKEDVEDEAHNTTRFVILAQEPKVPPAGTPDCVTSFVFRVRNVPAALYKAMGGFATNGINMTKLESYQLDGKFTATQFYAEIDGHPEERGVTLALEELGFFSTEIRVLGTYAASPFRRFGHQ
ncbi:MAG: prephenate dehydratase [Pseudomonadota bacterium]